MARGSGIQYIIKLLVVKTILAVNRLNREVFKVRTEVKNILAI